MLNYRRVNKNATNYLSKVDISQQIGKHVWNTNQNVICKQGRNSIRVRYFFSWRIWAPIWACCPRCQQRQGMQNAIDSIWLFKKKHAYFIPILGLFGTILYLNSVDSSGLESPPGWLQYGWKLEEDPTNRKWSRIPWVWWAPLKHRGFPIEGVNELWLLTSHSP